MSVRNLDKMFAPRSLTLIGASVRKNSVGEVLLRNLTSAGFAGEITAVNPHATSFGDIKSYPDVQSLPHVPDLAVIATPPATVPGLIADLAAKGTKAAVVITAGFGELGEAGRKLQTDMLIAARPSLLRIAGPNGLGIMAPGAGLNASFAHLTPLKGSIAFVSQSGAVVTAMLDWATTRGIGFSHIVSLGGMSDVDFGDMLDYLAHDPKTSSILLYVEQITEARKFMSAARHAARLKPVLVIKSGRHAEGAKAAQSHTGALAGSDAVYQAAFRRAGMLRVDGIEDLFDAVETLSTHPERRLLAGNRLTILTNGGGVGVLATDFALDEGARLAKLSPETIEKLDAVLPRTWSRANPVDMIGDAPASRYADSIDIVLRDQDTDAVLVLNCPTAVVDNVAAAHAVADAAVKSQKPVFTSWLGDQGARAGRQVFMDRGVPTYETPNQAIHAFMLQVRYLRNQRLLMEIPSDGPAWPDRDITKARSLVAKVLADGREWLNEWEAKELLAAYGIPVVETRMVKDADEAARVASELGFPAALKILSPDITHKTDVGGVALDLESADAVRQAAQHMLENVAMIAHGARVEGFTVQRMVSRPSAFELILGIVDDATFGPVLLFGQGGTAVEIIRDKAMALPPLNRVLADDLIHSTRISKLLEGYRGRRPADHEAIVGALMALGDLAADLPEVSELDINPLWADQSGVIALDARVRVKRATGDPTQRFAVKPYPSDLEGTLIARAGRTYPMRPIKPVDTPLIDDLLDHTDPEDSRMRFLSPLRRLPRQLAARLTQIDYDREMAFVVFTDDTQSAVAVVGRLSESPGRERAEYAILVRSDQQGLGLGYAMMVHLIAFARARGVGELFGHVLRENHSMLDMCKEFGFYRTSLEGEPGVLEVTLDLRPQA
ncbi:MAG: bifunctional acetate--CoA ligase family protein/GNAT family N-acetyltransferase [Parvibaculum sp.]|nr:bifunctional acetate--CoA ligase family protein/GNAT family N-acetyltransferase [Parvibaculum sp.]